MLEKLKRIIEYSQQINIGLHIPPPHIVADESQGTTVLNHPSINANQVVISMPLAKLSGNCDGMDGHYTFIIYTLEKARAMTETKYNVVEQYMVTLDIMSMLLEKISNDLGGRGVPEACAILAGMELIEIELLPSAGVFGSWNGYSAAITIK